MIFFIYFSRCALQPVSDNPFILLLVGFWCFPHHWPQYIPFSFLTSPFFYMLARIAWQFHLPIVVFSLFSGRSGLLDTTLQMYASTCYLETFWRPQPDRTWVFWYTAFTFFTPLWSLITQFQMCSYNDIPNKEVSWGLWKDQNFLLSRTQT